MHGRARRRRGRHFRYFLNNNDVNPGTGTRATASVLAQVPTSALRAEPLRLQACTVLHLTMPQRAAWHQHRALLFFVAVEFACTFHSNAEVALSVAQTHVFPAPSQLWPAFLRHDEASPHSLHLVGSRSCLILVEFSGDHTPSSPGIVVTSNASSEVFTFELSPPSTLPPTYGDSDPASVDDGEPYSTTAYWHELDADLVQPGLVVEVISNGETAGPPFPVRVGAPTHMNLVTVPFYFYGANESLRDDGIVLDEARTGGMPESAKQELLARLPIASLDATRRDGRLFKSSYAVFPPRNGRVAWRRRSTADPIPDNDYGAQIGLTMQLLEAMRWAEGKGPLVKYYGGLIQAHPDFTYQGPGGGLGGAHKGVGRYSYDNLFFHEIGHACGLAHAGGEFDASNYPYPNGGLKGSAWGYDQIENKFIDVFVHGSIEDPGECSDAQLALRDSTTSRCYKQDPMQGGGGNKHDGQIFSIFSDFHAGKLQSIFEESSVRSPDGDEYVTWNRDTLTYEACDACNRESDKTIHFEVDVAMIFASISAVELEAWRIAGPLNTSVLELTTVFPPMQYVGNAKAEIDADVDADLFRIWQADFQSYSQPLAELQGWCDRGCDFLYSITFADGSVKRVVINSSFKGYTRPENHYGIHEDASDPTHTKSHEFLAVAVPSGGRRAVRVDLLYAAEAWKGVHARVPQLITSWDAEIGEIPAPQQVEPSFSTLDLHVYVAIPRSVRECDLLPNLGFVHSIERAVFANLASSTSSPLPELSRVVLNCFCTHPEEGASPDITSRSHCLRCQNVRFSS